MTVNIKNTNVFKLNTHQILLLKICEVNLLNKCLKKINVLTYIILPIYYTLITPKYLFNFDEN